MIISVFFIFGLLVGCNKNGVQPETSPITNSQEQLPIIVRDDEGNEINANGWAFPTLHSERKIRSSREQQYKDGSPATIKVITYWVSEQRVLFYPTTLESKYDSVISNTSELRIGDGKIYCHEYAIVPYGKGGGNAIGVTTKYSFCDLDGDGKFERKGNGLRNPPDWTK